MITQLPSTGRADVALRPWATADGEALVKLADDRDIWLNMRERFPHPFTRATADLWLADRAKETPPYASFAVTFGGELAGGVRLHRFQDVHRIRAEIDFWTGRPFRGQGIATAAVKAASDYAFDALALQRVQTLVFDWSPIAARVLEKAGFTLEGRLRRFVLKDGRVGDGLMYAKIRD